MEDVPEQKKIRNVEEMSSMDIPLNPKVVTV